MPQDLILALDQGTTSTRCIAFRAPTLAPVATARRDLPQHFPDSGWVEHDPEDLWQHSLEVLREAMALVGHAGGFLSVDTVFMHIAAAMGVPRQWVIETPTLNPPVHPRRRDWTLIPNPSIGGRHLEFYRYDGRPIAGTAEALVAMMASVSVESVLDALEPWAAGL